MKKILGILIAVGVLSVSVQGNDKCYFKEQKCFNKCLRKHPYYVQNRNICNHRCVVKHQNCERNRPRVVRPAPIPPPDYYGWGPKYRHPHHHGYYWR